MNRVRTHPTLSLHPLQATTQADDGPEFPLREAEIEKACKKGPLAGISQYGASPQRYNLLVERWQRLNRIVKEFVTCSPNRQNTEVW